jgi:hypothetical protein
MVRLTAGLSNEGEIEYDNESGNEITDEGDEAEKRQRDINLQELRSNGRITTVMRQFFKNNTDYTITSSDRKKIFSFTQNKRRFGICKKHQTTTFPFGFRPQGELNCCKAERELQTC